jgi:hypothetical protein
MSLRDRLLLVSSLLLLTEDDKALFCPSLSKEECASRLTAAGPTAATDFITFLVAK